MPFGFDNPFDWNVVLRFIYVILKILQLFLRFSWIIFGHLVKNRIEVLENRVTAWSDDPCFLSNWGRPDDQYYMIVLYDVSERFRVKIELLKNLYFIMKTFFALNSFTSRTFSCKALLAEVICYPLYVQPWNLLKDGTTSITRYCQCIKWENNIFGIAHFTNESFGLTFFTVKFNVPCKICMDFGQKINQVSRINLSQIIQCVFTLEKLH